MGLFSRAVFAPDRCLGWIKLLVVKVDILWKQVDLDKRQGLRGSRHAERRKRGLEALFLFVFCMCIAFLFAILEDAQGPCGLHL